LPDRFWALGKNTSQVTSCERFHGMHILWTIILGLIVGAVAKLITPGRDPGGWIVTLVLGIAGSFLGTFLGRAVGWYQEGQSAGFIASVVGAVILLFLYRLLFKKREGQ
jgi:uncharacterized membrane protein YeaQ/YmgE (transglycosylase-associated protein family)